MYENFQSFKEYIKDHGLENRRTFISRYLSSVYKTLTQTVPFELRNDELDDLILFFETAPKTTDSSLIDEWRKIADPTIKPSEKTSDIDDDKTVLLSRDKNSPTPSSFDVINS